MSETLDLSVQSVDWLHGSDGSPVIYLNTLTRDRERVLVRVDNFPSNFYVTADSCDVDSALDVNGITGIDRFDGDGDVMRSIRGDRVYRVYTDKPGTVGSVRGRFTHFEADIPFGQRFIVDAEIQSGVRVEGTWRNGVFHVWLSANAPLNALAEKVKPIDLTVQPRVCMFDIEVDDRHGFPVDGESQIICLTSHDSERNEYDLWLYQSPEVEPEGEIPDDQLLDDDVRIDDAPISVHRYGTESGMLHGFIEYLEERDFDVFSGWNFTDFDMPYLIDRLKAIESDTGFDISPERLSPVGEIWSGYRGPNVKGVVPFDLLEGYKRTQRSRLDSYRLENVGSEVLDVGKTDYVGTLGNLWEDDPIELLRYNLRDVELCVELERRESVIAFWKEAADFVGCQLDEAPYAGGSCDIYTLHRCHGEYVLPSRGYKSGPSIEGATVFDPYNGVSEWVGVLDLASLYPMSMLSLNASPETKVDPDEFDGPMSYVPGEDVYFRTDQPGIVREMVLNLLDERDKRKAQRDEHEPGSQQYEVFDRQQAAVKVIMNALYGALSWSNFRLYDPDVAACVTSVGRSVLAKTKAVTESSDVEVLYGDSVPGSEPVLIRRQDGAIDVVEIRSLIGMLDVEVWTDDGFTVIHEVIEKPNRKQLYRVETGDGMVTVTEDHGLLTSDGEEVSPVDIEEGDELLHRDVADVPRSEPESSISADRAWLLGLFCADGHTRNHARSGKSTWKISKSDSELLEKAAVILENEFDISSKILDVRESTGTRQLVPYGNGYGRIPELCEEWRELCYDGEQKRVPLSVINGSDSAKHSWLAGYQAGDGDSDPRYDKLFHRASTKDRVLASGVAFLLRQIGSKYHLDCRDNHGNQYPRVAAVESTSHAASVVRSVTKVESDDESVYDLATDNHHFHAGIGSMIVHNTDSVLIDSKPAIEGESSKRKAIEVCELLETRINDSYDEFVPDQFGVDEHWFDIEFEKLYERYFQAGGKKRYAGRLAWKDGKDVAELDVTGFEYVRSDVASITKTVQRRVIEMIVDGFSVEEIEEYCFEQNRRLVDGELSIEDIMIPGGIGKDLTEYSSMTQQVKAALYANMLLGTNFSKGSKPRRIHIESIRWGEFDRFMAAENPSDTVGSVVTTRPEPSAICVEHPSQLPDCFVVDYETHAKKSLKNPVSTLLQAIGTSWKHATTDATETASVKDFM